MVSPLISKDVRIDAVNAVTRADIWLVPMEHAELYHNCSIRDAIQRYVRDPMYPITTQTFVGTE